MVASLAAYDCVSVSSTASMREATVITWKGTFAKHTMALPHQLAVPQAEQGAEEIPETNACVRAVALNYACEPDLQLYTMSVSAQGSPKLP